MEGKEQLYGFEARTRDERLEERRRERRRARIAQMRRQKERQERIRRLIKLAIPAVAAIALFAFLCNRILGWGITAFEKSRDSKASDTELALVQNADLLPDLPKSAGFDVVTGEDATTDTDAAFLSEGQKESSHLAGFGTDYGQGDMAAGMLGGGGSVGRQLSPFMSGYTTSAQAFEAHKSEKTTGLSGEIISNYGVLMDAQTGEILAARNPLERISPASMTKVLTVLVALENLPDEDLEKKVTIDIQTTDFSYRNDCSAVGFSVGEEVTVRDLFYGTILPSGGDAAYALAVYVAGSMEEFADLMNEKLTELGLSGSAHFTNCVGLYAEDHYCTIYDMAIIMDAAMRNDFLREVLSAHTYTTSKTEEHPDGITVSNWFLRRIEDKDSGGEVIGAKTGFVVQSRNCAVSYAEDKQGHPYICATAMSTSGWKCIYDHVAIYKAFFDKGGFAPESIRDTSEAFEEGADATEEESIEGED